MVTVIGITSLTNTPLFLALCVLLTQKQAQFLFGNNYHFSGLNHDLNFAQVQCCSVHRENRPFYWYSSHIEFKRSIIGWPGGTYSVFTCTFLAKRELHCIFLGKKAIIITSKHSTMIILFPLQSFSRKT